MKFDFQDTLKHSAIDFSFEPNDGIDREIYVDKAYIRWTLNIDVDQWGISKFNYELIELRMPFTVTTANDKGEDEDTEIFAEVKFNSNSKKQGYICKIYEDVLIDGEWEEDVFSLFPIEVSVEEKPTTDEGHRSQIYMKFIELEITPEKRKLSLSI